MQPPTEARHNITLELQYLKNTCYDFHATGHWKAGRQAHRAGRYLNVATILINAVIASSLLTIFKQSHETYYEAAVGILSLIAAIIGAYLLKFKPEENLAGHKTMGNQFSAIARDARITEQQLLTGFINAEQGWQTLAQLNQRYDQARQLAEQFDVGKKIRSELYRATEPQRQAILNQIKETTHEPKPQ